MQQSFWNQPTAPHLLSTEFQFNSILLCTTIWLHNMQNKTLVLLPEVDIEWFLSKLETFSFISIYLVEHTLWPQYFCWKTFEWIFVLRVFTTRFKWKQIEIAILFYGWLSSCKIFLVGLSTCNRLKETFKKHIVSVVSSL